MGHRLQLAGTLEDAAGKIASLMVDLLLVQTDAPGSGIPGRLRAGLSFGHRPYVIALARDGDIADAVRAVRAGADDYLPDSPVNGIELRGAIERALARPRVPPAGDAADHEGYGVFDSFITADHRTRAVCDIARTVADSRVALLLEGESGTGKTLLARLMHESSARRLAPFVEVSCGTLTESLLESELFGHVRGAFTSAYRGHPGRFEFADGGTVLLDEVGSASLQLQARLLRVVESGQFERVGGTETLQTNVHIVAATKTSLEEGVARGRFREGLYHRLNSLRVKLLPLRERVEDIPLLARHFLREFAGKHKRPARTFSPEAVARLVHYLWPGNVRELCNIIEHAVILTQDSVITAEKLPPHVAAPAGDTAGRRSLFPSSLREAMRDPERRCILEALKIAHWNKQYAARKLRISRSTLYKKIKEYGLDEQESTSAALVSKGLVQWQSI